MIYEKKTDIVKRNVIADRTKNSYFVAFGKQAFVRPACYKCIYNEVERISDFTCGGYFGDEKKIGMLDGYLGISQIIIHTAKARMIFEELKPKIKWMTITLKEAKKGNKMLYSSVPECVRKPEMFDYLARYGYSKTAKKYFPVRKFAKIRNMIPVPIRKTILNALNKIRR